MNTTLILFKTKTKKCLEMKILARKNNILKKKSYIKIPSFFKGLRRKEVGDKEAHNKNFIF